jgi:hypothetical protein
MLFIEPEVDSRRLLLNELSELLGLLCLESFESFELFVDPFKLPFAGEVDSFEIASFEIVSFEIASFGIDSFEPALLPLTPSEARESLARLIPVNMIISSCFVFILTSL